MKKIILLLLSLSLQYTHAQTNVKDSLKQLLQKEKTDTGRTRLLLSLSDFFTSSSADTSLLLAFEALALAKRIGYLRGEAVSLNMIGNSFDILGNYPRAMESYLQSLKINEKINNIQGSANNLGNIGNMYSAQEDYRQALVYTFKATSLVEKLNNKKGIAHSLLNIGSLYARLKIFDSARLYTQRGYDASDRLGEGFYRTKGMGRALANLGYIYFETGQTNLALEYYRLSIPYYEKTEREIWLGESFSEIAKVFEKNGQNDSSLFYGKQALLLAQKTKFTRGILNASNFLYSFYKGRRNVDSALYYMEVAKAANDSLFNQQKLRQFQSLSIDEKLRQQEIAEVALKANEKHKHNIQYAAIAVGLITFIILFLMLSRSIIVKTKFIEFFGVLGLLAVFEFINLFIHPYLAHVTHDSPLLMLVVLIAIGAMLVPFHHRLEKWMTKIMVEKNIKIRLAAAKKTIEQLGDKTDKL